MPPKPRGNWHQAFDAQMALYAWYQTELAQRWMQQSLHMNTHDIAANHPDSVKLSRDLYNAELTRLIDCDPIFVSADMCELIDYAKESFKPEPLLDTDLITPRAFLYYETPFTVPDRFDIPIQVQAVSWTRIIASDVEFAPEQAEAVRTALAGVADIEVKKGSLTVHAHDRETTDTVSIENVLLEHGAVSRGIGLTIYATTEVEKMHGDYRLYEYPPVLPMHLTPWYFNMTFEGNEVDVNNIPTGAVWWWKILQTTLRMMQQKISTKHHYRPDRAGRREMKRHGYHPDFETVVVRLRGEESERKEPSGNKANFTYRHIRRGHWRNQPYSSENIYRQIWIDPTIVGDADLPLVVKPRRAFQWSR